MHYLSLLLLDPLWAYLCFAEVQDCQMVNLCTNFCESRRCALIIKKLLSEKACLVIFQVTHFEQ